ncbi:MAG: exosome complex RNA-binding protein Rrp4 [Candidatus Woesearchaeota archaeon]|nr:exosome complex RNA-binding protein Rrp4 [Candidatus Woesearchaeota archaeon]
MTESTVLVKDKTVVAPGQALANGMEFFPGPGTYREGDTIRANQIGMLTVDGKVLKTTPLAGRYTPKVDDVVIGRVEDILMSGWRIDFNCPYSAVLPLQDATTDFIKKGADLTEYFELDDFVACKITQVTSQNLIDVSMKGPGLRKLKGGQFLRVNSAKVPRLIGRKGSMVSMLKDATGCQIVVGQNGVVWLNGENEALAVTMVQRIENEAHIPGLTEKIKTTLEKETGKKIDMAAIQEEERKQFEERKSFERKSFERKRFDRKPRFNKPRQKAFKK